jgi:protein involved in polysaccharide export with SLBB domain
MKTLLSTLALLALPLAPRAESNVPSTVSVIGMVQAPGAYTVDAESTVWSVMQQAKGVVVVWSGKVIITRQVDGKKVSTTYSTNSRRTDDTTKEYWSSIKVMPGDIVFFQEIIC